jgi:predicted lipid carrier protein YhbT
MNFGHVVDNRDRLRDAGDAAGALKVTQKRSKLAKARQTAHSAQNIPIAVNLSLTESKVVGAAAMHGCAMRRRHPVPQIPAVVRLGLWSLPHAFIELAVRHLVRSISTRHPSMFERLGGHVGRRFVVAPTDLPFVIAITLDLNEPAVSVAPARRPLAADARIAGPIAALMGLAQGRYDGDALFFSGDITIEGDTEIVLALRNALDAAEIDLLQEGTAMFGPLSCLLEQLIRPTAPLVERYTGLALTRSPSAAR